MSQPTYGETWAGSKSEVWWRAQSRHSQSHTAVCGGDLQKHIAETHCTGTCCNRFACHFSEHRIYNLLEALNLLLVFGMLPLLSFLLSI